MLQFWLSHSANCFYVCHSPRDQALNLKDANMWVKFYLLINFVELQFNFEYIAVLFKRCTYYLYNVKPFLDRYGSYWRYYAGRVKSGDKNWTSLFYCLWWGRKSWSQVNHRIWPKPELFYDTFFYYITVGTVFIMVFSYFT